MPIFTFSRSPNVYQLKLDRDVDGLIEALSFQDDHNVRLAAASALGEIGSVRAVEPLIAVLGDRPRVSEVAVIALGEIGDPSAVENLLLALEDADWEIRSTIAKTLGKIGDPKAISALIEMLTDKHENVRWYASQALETITGDSFGEDITQWESKYKKNI